MEGKLGNLGYVLYSVLISYLQYIFFLLFVCNIENKYRGILHIRWAWTDQEDSQGQLFRCTGHIDKCTRFKKNFIAIETPSPVLNPTTFSIKIVAVFEILQ